MRKIKTSMIAVLLISMFIQLFAGVAIAASDAGVIGNDQAGHEYDNIDLEAAQKDQVVVETTVVDTNKSFSDIKDPVISKYAEFLNILGIFGGYGDGTFGPDNNITRGEMAAVVMRMYNYNIDKVGTLAGDFYDIEEGDMFFDDISSAVAMGIITGYDDNSYRPNNNISYTELVAILVRVLGYEQYAQLNGGYPTGYLITAKETGILKSFSYKDESALTRAEAATLVFNALHSPILEQVSYGDDIQTAKDKNVTPLSKYFNIFKGEGVVNTNNVTTICELPSTANTMVIGSTRYLTENNNFKNYIGYKVSFYYKDDTETKTVVFMEKHKDVVELELSTNDILSYADLTYKYTKDDEKINTAKIDTLHKLIYNGTYFKEYKDTIFNITSGSVKLVSNDGSENYTVVMINEYTNFVLSSISGSGDRVTMIPSYSLKDIIVDLAKTELDFVNIDGSAINYIVTIVGAYDASGKPLTSMDFGDVSSGSVISIFADEFDTTTQRNHVSPSEDAKNIKVIVSKETVEGTLEAINEETGAYIIDGKEYYLAPSNFMDELDSTCNLGDTGKFKLDCYGKIVSFTKTSADDYTYGYIINAAFSGDGLSPYLEMKLITYNGSISVFQLADKVLVNGTPKTHQKVYEHLNETAGMLREGFEISQLIKYKTNEDGEISDIQTVLQSVGLPDGMPERSHLNRDKLPATYSVETDTSGRLKTPGGNLGHYFNPRRYFTVPSTETKDDDTLFSVGGVTSYSNRTVELYDVKNLIPIVAIIYSNTSGSGSGTSGSNNESYIYATGWQSPVMVKDVKMAIDEDGFASAQLSVITGIAEKTYMAESAEVLDGLEPGDMIRPKTKGKNIVSGYDRVEYNGIPITAANIEAGLFDLADCVSIDTDGNRSWATGTSSINDTNDTGYRFAYNRFAEVYFTHLTDGMMVVQAGEVVDEDLNKREFVYTGHINSNTAWQQGGTILFDATNSREKPVVRTGTFADVKSVYADGAENASLIFFQPIHGGSRQYIIYNGLR